MRPSPQELYAQIYDVYVPDWPGEIVFYRQLIAGSGLASEGLLEIACGTGRVALQLARDGLPVTGLDLSPELLAVARSKSEGLPNVNWVQDDMRSFDIGRTFGIAISPGHSFQFMLTPDDQVRCLETVRRHLVPGGILVLHLDHQDFGWLGGLVTQEKPVAEKGKVLTYPITGQKFRGSYEWAYEPGTQLARLNMAWEELNDQGDVIDVWHMPPLALHCAFRFEIEHLLRRTGFSIEAVYGDFDRGELASLSGQMIWVARNTSA